MHTTAVQGLDKHTAEEFHVEKYLIQGCQIHTKQKELPTTGIPGENPFNYLLGNLLSLEDF